MSKEMVGGCCVCSDEHGWSENPLVYCDGKGCSVAVHQACYGIVSVPSGNWYCRKCESQERAARVKCELCPSKDGAVKKTDTNGWAHVVCALYIPEVRFGNVTTMEPIILNLIPPERFNRTCYICQEQGKAGKSTTGACMQCNKSGCKQQFHVTCAQALGLLCEEAGNYLDNVKYCGYCQHHYSKLRKGPHVKAVPPFKPVSTADHDSSPEKESEALRDGDKRKNYMIIKSSPQISAGKSKLDETIEDVSMDTATEEGGESTLKFGTTTSHAPDAKKFTTSNFVETVVTQSDPVFGSDVKQDTSEATGKNKKRKGSVSGKSDTSGDSGISASRTPVSTITSTTGINKSLSVTLTNAKSSPLQPLKSTAGASGLPAPPPPKTNLTVYGSGTKITIAVPRDDPKKTKADLVASSSGSLASNTDSGMFSPAAAASSPGTSTFSIAESQAGKRSRSSSAEKGRKPKRTPTKRASVPIKDEIDSPPNSPEGSRSVVRRKPAAIKEEKEAKVIHTLTAPHMLGNQLNPASSMAQKMNDSLHQEVEAHSIYSHDSPTSNLVGPPLAHRVRAAVNSEKTATLSAANSLLSLGNQTNQINEPIEALLEKHWDMGSALVMDQAQHFDIASLLSCLHQLKNDNIVLEEKVTALTARRDRLLAINARINGPLNLNPLPTTAPTSEAHEVSVTALQRPPQVRMENGIGHATDASHNYVQNLHNRGQQQQPSPTLRPAGMVTVYSNQQARRPVVSSYPAYPGQQMPSANNPSMGVRRDDHNQQM